MISQLILKLNRTCNLACDYCYYINADTEQPGLKLSVDHAMLMLDRFYDYLKQRDTSGSVSFHGGEPLLMGIKYFEAICSHPGFGDGTFNATLQTNGVRLNPEWIDFLQKMKFSIGISFDGTAGAQNRNRQFASGRGSYDHVVRSFKRMQEKDFPFGVLCVIDPKEDGGAIYRNLQSLNIKSADLLFPIATLDDQFVDEGYKKGILNYIQLFFLHWIEDGGGIKVRLFNNIFKRGLGKDIEFGSIGYSSYDYFYCVLETDGTVHYEEDLNTKQFRVSRLGFKPIPLDKFASFDALEVMFQEHSQKTGMLETPSDCIRCSARGICLSGHPSSRYSETNGFDNASINCSSLYWLSETVGRLLREQAA